MIMDMNIFKSFIIDTLAILYTRVDSVYETAITLKKYINLANGIDLEGNFISDFDGYENRYRGTEGYTFIASLICFTLSIGFGYDMVSTPPTKELMDALTGKMIGKDWKKLFYLYSNDVEMVTSAISYYCDYSEEDFECTEEEEEQIQAIVISWMEEQEVQLRKIDWTPDESIQEMVFSHGIAAYRGNRRYDSNEEAAERVAEVMSKEFSSYQIACSHNTQEIGPLGVYVTGRALYASNKDLYSEIGEGGERVFNLLAMSKFLIKNSSEIDFSIHSHMEFIVESTTIQGWWIKKAFAEKPIGAYTVELLKSLGQRVTILDKP